MRVFPSREGKLSEAKPQLWVTPRNVQPSIIIDNNMIIKVIINASISMLNSLPHPAPRLICWSSE